jgi:hypothetical protein
MSALMHLGLPAGFVLQHVAGLLPIHFCLLKKSDVNRPRCFHFFFKMSFLLLQNAKIIAHVLFVLFFHLLRLVTT